MNLYRGCGHDCVYCDGRAESYHVDGDFAGDAVYKENAVDILTRELDPRRRRKEFRPGYLFIGGGVSDSWQPAEEKLRLTRRVLELLKYFPYPLLVLTKSDLVLRDFDLLTALAAEHRVTVAVSLSTVNEGLASLLEPGASPPAARLEVIRRARASGLGAGVMMMPVVPMLSDTPVELLNTYTAALEAGAEFVCSGPMTLKPGRQKEYFFQKTADQFPDLRAAYQTVYGAVPDRWGHPSSAYFEYLAPLLHDVGRRIPLPRRIPSRLFPGNLSAAERAGVILEQMDGLLRERGLTSTYGRASRALHALDVPLESPEGWKNLRRLGGVGPSTERLIREILETGSAGVYERLLVGGNPSG